VKLINKRIYLDNNATAPLAETVQQWYAKGALPFGNPSSIHTSGKQAKKYINETTSYLKSLFKIPKFEIFYHSGATEGINSIIKGFCINKMSHKKDFHVVVFSTDHSCVVNQREHVELFGGSFHELKVDENGDFKIDEVVDYISNLSGDVLLNYTLINNESGVVWSLNDAIEIKSKTNCFVHIDAVQLVGKFTKDLSLSEQIDFYTFSGHKFGAMKGIGFSLLKDPSQNWSALIRGGGQQQAMRSGTENVHGIYSLKLALEELVQGFDTELLGAEKKLIEDALIENYQDRIKIVSQHAKKRNLNTIYMIVDGVKTDILITAFDMAQIDLSSGSACSSGTVKPSRVLLAMGYSEEQAKNSIRLSLPYNISSGDSEVIISKLRSVLDRFLKK
jgi:cysteine desulfurase